MTRVEGFLSVLGGAMVVLLLTIGCGTGTIEIEPSANGQAASLDDLLLGCGPGGCPWNNQGTDGGQGGSNGQNGDGCPYRDGGCNGGGGSSPPSQDGGCNGGGGSSPPGQDGGSNGSASSNCGMTAVTCQQGCFKQYLYEPCASQQQTTEGENAQQGFQNIDWNCVATAIQEHKTEIVGCIDSCWGTYLDCVLSQLVPAK